MASQDEPFYNGADDARILVNLASNKLTVDTICDYFGVPKEKRNHPNLGRWIVKWIIQSQKTMPTKRPDELFQNEPDEASGVFKNETQD